MLILFRFIRLRYDLHKCFQYSSFRTISLVLKAQIHQLVNSFKLLILNKDHAVSPECHRQDILFIGTNPFSVPDVIHLFREFTVCESHFFRLQHNHPVCVAGLFTVENSKPPFLRILFIHSAADIDMAAMKDAFPNDAIAVAGKNIRICYQTEVFFIGKRKD